MPLVVDVPLNTAIADLDEALRKLLRRELERHGFEGVEIAFDAPSKDWSGKLTSPTVDLFLYDLREAVERAADHADRDARQRPGDRDAAAAAARADLLGDRLDEGGRGRAPAALAGARRSSSPTSSLPGDVLGRQRAQRRPALAEARRSVGRPREEKADFWSSVGGTYKASIDYVVHITIESGATFVRGPEVRTQTIRTRLSDGPARHDHRDAPLRRQRARRRRRAASPTPGSRCPRPGCWAVDRPPRPLPVRPDPARHAPRGRADARAATRRRPTIEVPGAPADLVIGSGGRAGAKKGAERKK